MSALDVGLLCHGWFPDAGGVESHTRDLARELQARGHRVVALCLDYDPEREPYTTREEEVEGVVVRRMAYLYQDQRALADLVRNRRAEDVLLAWLAEQPVDVVHVHHLTGWGLGALRALHDVGRPTLMTLHDYWPLCPRGQMLRPERDVCSRPDPGRCAPCLAATWPHLLPTGGGEARGPDDDPVADDLGAADARTRFALECLELPERLATPSRRAREVYARAGLDPERIRVVENGIDVSGLAAAVAARRAEQGSARSAGAGLRLGALGTVLPSKGQLELARAFLAADLPGASLHVHGAMPSYHGDESYAEELRALAAADERVVLHGAYVLEELPSILAGVDAVAANSRWEEVYGLTVREAAAVGLPVLVSDAGDLAAVARGGAAGAVVPVDDAEAWGEVLRTWYGDADARRRWAESERRVHSAGAMVDELERLYREAIAVAGGDPGAPAEEPGTAAESSGGGVVEPPRSLLWRLLHRRRR